MYTTGRGGGGGVRVIVFGGFIKIFWREKGGMVKISEGRKGGGQFFLDAVERLNICDFIDKPLLTLLKFLIF